MRLIKFFFTAAICVLMSSCSSVGRQGDGQVQESRKGSIDMQAAARKADFLLLDTLDSLNPKVRWVHVMSTDSACSDWGNESMGLGSVVRRAAVVTKVSDRKKVTLLEKVEAHWKKSGYVLTGRNESKSFPALYAATLQDFRFGINFGYRNQVFLDVATPCFRRSRVDPPVTGPRYVPRRPPLPNVHSDYWSAGGPSSSVGPADQP